MDQTASLSNTMLLSQRDEDGVLHLTLNHPAARNALSLEMITRLREAFDGAAKDPKARVIILKGVGSVFSSGHDLKEMTAHRQDPDGGKGFYEQLFARCSDLMQAMVHHPLPIIAQIEGLATAAGCQLVASCDLALATPEARFATPGVNLGLFCSTPMVALSRAVGRKQAMEMLLTGDMTSADEALRIGLINRIVPADQIEAQSLALAQKIASKARATLQVGKQAFYQQVEMPLSAAYDLASQVMTLNMLGPEAEEGIGAFLGKRPPVWP